MQYIWYIFVRGLLRF